MNLISGLGNRASCLGYLTNNSHSEPGWFIFLKKGRTILWNMRANLILHIIGITFYFYGWKGKDSLFGIWTGNGKEMNIIITILAGRENEVSSNWLNES